MFGRSFYAKESISEVNPGHLDSAQCIILTARSKNSSHIVPMRLEFVENSELFYIATSLSENSTYVQRLPLIAALQAFEPSVTRQISLQRDVVDQYRIHAISLVMRRCCLVMLPIPSVADQFEPPDHFSNSEEP